LFSAGPRPANLGAGEIFGIARYLDRRIVRGSENRLLRADDLDQWLNKVEPGRPASVFTDDVADTHHALEQIAESEAEPARIVTLSWQRVPALGNELGLLVTALAKATLELFPSLYGLSLTTRQRWTHSDLETAAHEITRRIPSVLGAACRQILGACHKGEAPDIRKLSNSERVHQLALAIEPSKLLILIAVNDAEASKSSLRALALGAEHARSLKHPRLRASGQFAGVSATV